MTKILRVGTCEVCGVGCVGARVPASGARVVALCDECGAVWLDKACGDGPFFPGPPDFPCPREGSSLRHSPAHWATRREVEVAGWGDSVLEEFDS